VRLGREEDGYPVGRAVLGGGDNGMVLGIAHDHEGDAL
jgi:hypothetical protein